MVIAEKLVTALERGEANTRWRDFADILTISITHEVLASELRAALDAVSTYRGVRPRPLLPALETMAGAAQAKWAIWRRRQTHADQLPEQFADVLSTIANFTDPILNNALPDNAHWTPNRKTWDRDRPDPDRGIWEKG